MQISKKTALIAGLLIVLAALGTWYLTKPAKAKLAASTAIPVRVVNVAEKDVPRYVSGIGSVLSLHSVVVRPQIDGILTQNLLPRMAMEFLQASVDAKAINKIEVSAANNDFVIRYV